MRTIFTFRLPLAGIALACALSARVSCAAPGEVDLSFGDPTIGVSDAVKTVAIQPDGKLLIGGKFTYVKNLARTRIARLNSDGMGDPTFDPGRGANDDVSDIAVQPDGRIVIVGEFTEVDDARRNFIARLHPDGQLDRSFDPGTGANREINTVVLQPDGKVLIGGWFTTVNGASRSSIARLHADGSLDATFNEGGGVDSQVSAIALQKDGKVLVGGQFTEVNGKARRGVARLLPDGALDLGFDASPGPDREVYSIVVQPDGKLLIGGSFASIQGVSYSGIARLLADGRLDGAFTPPPSHNRRVRTVALQPDGKVLMGGLAQDGTWSGLTRLQPDGSPDSTYQGPSLGADIRAVVVQTNGRVVAAGGSIGLNGYGFVSIARFETGGRLDPAFSLGKMPTRAEDFERIHALARDPNGKVLLGGRFLNVNGLPRYGLARLQPDGALDTSFELDKSIDVGLGIFALALQPDGKTLIGGQFFREPSWRGLARLNADGQMDATFKPGTELSFITYSIALQPDGRILVGGWYGQISPRPRSRILRLTSGGSRDGTFNFPAEEMSRISSLVLQPDGKLVVAGAFLGANRVGVARLHSDGSWDTTFNAGGVWGLGEMERLVNAIAVQPDGKVVAAGFYAEANGFHKHYVVRLHPDGSVDPTFHAAAGLVNCIGVQPDGKIMLGGEFDSVDGVRRPLIARLHTDGRVDMGFDPGSGANRSVRAFLMESDGRVLVGGDFTFLNGVPRARVARLLTSEAWAGPMGFADGFPVFDVTGVAGLAVAVQASSDLRHWDHIQSLTLGKVAVRFRDTNHAAFARQFYRLSWPFNLLPGD